MIRALRLIFPVLSIGLLGLGYSFAHLTWPVIAIVLFGVLWVVALTRQWIWIAPLGLFVGFGAAAIGFFLDSSQDLPISLAAGSTGQFGRGELGPAAVLLLLGALFAFIAWDLAEFLVRLNLSAEEDDTTRLKSAHLRRLAFVIVASIVLGALVLTFQIKLSFEWIVVLMLFSIWGIGRIIHRLLKKQV
jgi:hypothetical protein